MKRILEDVIPVGTPWGGPESVRYLSSFVSMLMKVEGYEGAEKDLQARHERSYHQYLAVTGIGVSTLWSDRLAPFPDSQVVDRFCPDYIERSMAYAGYRHRVLEKKAICADQSEAKRAITESVDRGVPVLICSDASEWSVVTGYDRDGEVLIGWDGSQNSYWLPPVIKPDEHLVNGMFATASWPDTTSRFVIVEGKATPQAATGDVLRHLVSVLEEQRSQGYEKELMARLYDDIYCASADEQTLRDLWGYANEYVGWYAESRCFMAFALLDILPTLPDARENGPLVEAMKKPGGLMFHTHDICWEAWRAIRTTHRCDLPGNVPCRMCGGCLREAVEEDFAAFRMPRMRRRLCGYLQVVDWNDGKLLTELERCVELL